MTFLGGIKSLIPLRVKQRIWADRQSLSEIGLSAAARYRLERLSSRYRRAFQSENPKITVCIATYNRADLLISRAIPSILNQTYQNLELIVVGDGCTDRTGERVVAIDDPRLTFLNLAKRGDYPDDPSLRWMVAGSAAMNQALTMATGEFITHLDDDDEHRQDRLEKLLRFAQRQQADLVYHPFEYQDLEGRWHLNPAESFSLGKVTTSSVFYHHWFSRVHWDLFAYKIREPGDWNRFRKIRFLGAKSVRNDEVLLKHYKERSQKSL